MKHFLRIGLLITIVTVQQLFGFVIGLMVRDGTIKTDEKMNRYVEFPVYQSALSHGDVKFHYKTISGTAKEGIDYVNTVGEATIKSGERSTSIRVPLLSPAKSKNSKEKKFVLLIESNQVGISKKSGEISLQNETDANRLEKTK